MPQYCFNKPNRLLPRRYSARDAGRIICYARRGGATLKEILAEAESYGCVAPEERCDCERINSVLTEVLEALATLAVFLLIPQALVVRLSLPIVRLVARFLPGLSPLVAQLTAELASAQGALGRAVSMVKGLL